MRSIMALQAAEPPKCPIPFLDIPKPPATEPPTCSIPFLEIPKPADSEAQQLPHTDFKSKYPCTFHLHQHSIPHNYIPLAALLSSTVTALAGSRKNCEKLSKCFTDFKSMNIIIYVFSPISGELHSSSDSIKKSRLSLSLKKTRSMRLSQSSIMTNDESANSDKEIQVSLISQPFLLFHYINTIISFSHRLFQAHPSPLTTRS